jgi:WD repeat-containing protein 23
LISNAKDQSIKLWDIRHTSDNEAIKLARKAVENIRWDYRFEPPPQQVGKHSEMMDDVSLVTYRGHTVLKSLVRCHFSPVHTTGQVY